jgi:Ca2+-binding RTX toxin-like protein
LLIPDEIHVEDKATSPDVTRDLNFVTGVDGVGNVVFQITEGTPATDLAGNLLTFNGVQLYLYYGADQTVLIASTSTTKAGITTANTGFWIDIDPAADTYTMHSNGVIENGTSISSATIQTVGGGNKEWKAFIDLDGTQEDALLTATSGQSVNTNNGEIGISGGQSFVLGEGLRIDLVNGLTTSGSGGGETYSITGPHNLTNTFGQIVTFVNQGGAGTQYANVTVSAIIANDFATPFYDDADDTKVNLSVTDISVYDQNGVLTTTGITLIDNADGSITINGLQANWTFEINSATEFNAVQIDAATGCSEFKLGVFYYGETFAGSPVDLEYAIVGTDGDGDAVSGSIHATLYPDAGATIPGGTGDDTLTGDNALNYLLGDGGNDTLYGLGGDDTLVGDVGNDALYGGDGNDVLLGGPGNDTLAGGAGNDTFVWHLADKGTTASPATDTVTDFSAGDVLDLADLLPDSNTANYLSVTQDGTGTTIHVTDGAGNDVQTIFLDGYTAADDSAANILAKLVTDQGYTGV